MPARSGRRGGVLEATVFAIAGIAILIGLGLWQLDRKVWKENLIATVSMRTARAPEAMPPRDAWERLVPAGNEYSHVAFSAEFLDGQEAYAYTAGSSLRRRAQSSRGCSSRRGMRMARSGSGTSICTNRRSAKRSRMMSR